MKTRIFNNFLLKLLSVAAAVLLWVIVLDIDNPVQNRTFRGIRVEMVNTDVITSQDQTYRIEEGSDTVDLTVYARRSVLDKLKASDFRVTADMQKDLRYDSMVRIDVEYTGSYYLEKIEQSRINVAVSIEEEVTEQFKVRVNTSGNPGNGMVEGTAIPERTLVEVTGPVSVVERIKRVEANINIAGITGTAVRTCKLKILDGDGKEIDNTRLEYIGKNEDFKVTVTPLNSKLAGISFDVSKAAPEGYGLAGISYKPETVTIAGEKTRITGIYNLDIPPEALNPEGKTGSVEQLVDISRYLPDGVIIPDETEQEIVVMMEIVPLKTTVYQFSPEQIHFLNLKEGLSVDPSETSVLEVSISGTESDLSLLMQEAVTVTVDLSECTRTGTYTLPAAVTAPEKYSVPQELQISVKLVRAEEE